MTTAEIEAAKARAKSRAFVTDGVSLVIRLADECLRRGERIVELETRLLSAAGDDLCRLTQEEIKAMSAGTVKIPPKDEFLASCERFHAQVAGESGVMENCLTLAQLVAENAKLQADLATARAELDEACQLGKQMRTIVDQACDERDKAMEQLAACREALEPFAEILRGNYANQVNGMTIVLGANSFDLRFMLTLGQFRKAAAVLAATKGGE